MDFNLKKSNSIALMGVVLVKKHKTFFFSLKDVSVNYKYTKPHTESEDIQELLMEANRSK